VVNGTSDDSLQNDSLAHVRDELRRLQDVWESNPSSDLAAQMIDLRMQGGQLSRDALVDWPTEHDNRFEGQGNFPEINTTELNPAALKAGVLGKGAVIVRGFMRNDTVAMLKHCIDATLRCPGRLGAQESASRSEAWFHRSSRVAGGPARIRGGELSPESGSVWAVDSPMTASHLIDFYSQMGLRETLFAYFNEEALLSVRKWVLRKAPPTKGPPFKGWHQDGRFMGDDIRSLNLWIALSECGTGTAAPGLELLANNCRRIYPTGTHGAMLDWTVGPELIDELKRSSPVVCPYFEAGDAIFFDHYSLHRTAEGPNDSLPRYAVESWFFAASTAPAKQQPLLF